MRQTLYSGSRFRHDDVPPSQVANPPGWPFDAAEAKKRQAAAGAPASLKKWLAFRRATSYILAGKGDSPMLMLELEGLGVGDIDLVEHEHRRPVAGLKLL